MAPVALTTPPGKHVVLYDGHCRFCTGQARNLVALARKGALELRSFQDTGVLDAFPGITHDACMEAMHLVTPGGRVYRGFEAVARSVATRRVLAPFALLYYIPGIRQACDALYALVARNRYRIMGRAVASGECTDACALHLKRPPRAAPLLLLLAAAPFLALAFARAEDKPRDPFPLDAGRRWTYVERRTGGFGGGAEEHAVVFKVAERKRVKGRDCAVVRADYDDRRSIELSYASTDRGIELVSKVVTIDGKAGADEVDKPELFLKLPLRKGDKWDYGHFNVETSDDEQVEVPAGKFKCTKVVLKRTWKGPRPICNIIGSAETITIWLAPGTGIARETWTPVLPVVPREPPVFTRELKAAEK